MIIKYLFVICFFLTGLMAYPASASNSTVFEIENIEEDTVLSYNDNILSEFRLLDDSDKIFEIKTTLKSTDNSISGLSFNLSDRVTYTITVNKSTWLGIMPYKTVTHWATISVPNGTNFTNYTLFRVSENRFNIIDSGLTSYIKYDTSGWTTFRLNDGMFGSNKYAEKFQISAMENETNFYAGMPANKAVITGLAPFDVEVSIIDVGKKVALQKKKESLSWLSVVVYTVLNSAYKLLTLNPWAESEDLLTLLTAVDWIFLLVTLLFAAIYTYPYLIAFWILTLGNIYSGYLASTPKDVVKNYIHYYSFMFGGFYRLVLTVIDKVMSVFRLIRGSG